MTSTAPGTSSLVEPGTTSSAGSTARAAITTATPTGTFTRKIQCHDKQAGQHAAEQDADGAAAGHHEAEDAHRLGPVTGSAEQPHDQGQGDRGHGGAGQTLDRTAHDEERRAGRQAADGRGDREGDHTAEEHPAVADQVAEPPGQQQEAAEGEQVGVHDPGERGLREAEVGADGGQGDVHDALVEHDHQVAQAQHVKGQPAALRRGRGAVLSLRGGLGGGHLGLLGLEGSSPLPRTGAD